MEARTEPFAAAGRRIGWIIAALHALRVATFRADRYAAFVFVRRRRFVGDAAGSTLETMMTYCLGLNLNEGVVMLSDSRTNAGVDNISTFGKLFTWSVPAPATNARAISIATAGNLSITQEVLSLIEEENLANGAAQDGGLVTILSASNMYRVVERIGALLTQVKTKRAAQLSAAGVASGASMLVSGRVGSERARLFLVYDAGNFIEATVDTPFMQIGEPKYGKPILDRMVTPATPLNQGVTAALLSMDATLRSNLGVGMPLDLAVSRTGAYDWVRRRIEPGDPSFEAISRHWTQVLQNGFLASPTLEI